MKSKLNDMVRIERDGKFAWITVPQGNGQEFVKCIKALNNSATIKVYTVGRMPLEDLPEDVQEDVRDTLMAYPTCNVTFEHGRFTASPSTFISQNYPDDDFACGTYRAEDIFTPEERRRNFIETFGYAPAHA